MKNLHVYIYRKWEICSTLQLNVIVRRQKHCSIWVINAWLAFLSARTHIGIPVNNQQHFLKAVFLLRVNGFWAEGGQSRVNGAIVRPRCWKGGILQTHIPRRPCRKKSSDDCNPAQVSGLYSTNCNISSCCVRLLICLELFFSSRKYVSVPHNVWSVSSVGVLRC